MDDREVLENTSFIVEVAPSSGGSVTRFDYKGSGTTYPVFRRCETTLADSLLPLDAACFPLLPYSNRLRYGCFSADGRTYRHKLNCLPEVHSSHGDAWMRPWRVVCISDQHIEMRLEPETEQPIKYSGVQIIRLCKGSVSISLEITNADTVRGPFGIGIHPYFNRTTDTILRCHLKSQWALDHELLPVQTQVNRLQAQMQNGISVSDLSESGAYFGRSTDAEIVWPSSGLRVRVSTMPAQRHAIVWCPVGQDYFCYEPVSHMVDGFNMAEAGIENTGVIYLNPGNSYKAVWTFSVSKD